MMKLKSSPGNLIFPTASTTGVDVDHGVADSRQQPHSKPHHSQQQHSQQQPPPPPPFPPQHHHPLSQDCSPRSVKSETSPGSTTSIKGSSSSPRDGSVKNGYSDSPRRNEIDEGGKGGAHNNHNKLLRPQLTPHSPPFPPHHPPPHHPHQSFVMMNKPHILNLPLNIHFGSQSTVLCLPASGPQPLPPLPPPLTSMPCSSSSSSTMVVANNFSDASADPNYPSSRPPLPPQSRPHPLHLPPPPPQARRQTNRGSPPPPPHLAGRNVTSTSHARFRDEAGSGDGAVASIDASMAARDKLSAAAAAAAAPTANDERSQERENTWKQNNGTRLSYHDYIMYPKRHMVAPQRQVGGPWGQMGKLQRQMGKLQRQMGAPQWQMGGPQGQMGGAGRTEKDVRVKVKF